MNKLAINSLNLTNLSVGGYAVSVFEITNPTKKAETANIFSKALYFFMRLLENTEIDINLLSIIDGLNQKINV